MAGKYVFTGHLKEMRFLFCQTSEHSSATRSFLTRAYPTMKKNNPHTPILLREALGTEPRVYARYERGEEKQESLSGGMVRHILKEESRGADAVSSGLTDKEIEDKVTGLVKTAA